MDEALNRYALRKSDIQDGDAPDPNFAAIYVDGQSIKACFAFYLDEGRVGTYDTRGDGVPHINDAGDGADVKWLTGAVEIEDKAGVRWI